MADNKFKPGNDLSQFSKLTNPLTAPTNGMKMRVEKVGGQLEEIVLDLTVDTTTTKTVEVKTNAPTSGYVARYCKIEIKDENGKLGEINILGDLSAGGFIDISALDPNLTWYVGFYFSTSADLLVAGDYETTGTIVIENASSDPVVVVDTVLLRSPKFEVYEADGTTIIADGGTYSGVPAFTVNTGVQQFPLVLKNPGGSVAKIESMAFSLGWVSAGSNVPGYVYIDQEETFLINVDTNAVGAGGYTPTITFTTNDEKNSVYDVTVEITISA